MKLEFYRQIFEKYTSIKFHENPLNGSRIVAAGWMYRQADRRTDRGTDRQTDRRTDRRTNTRTDRQTDRQTDMKPRVAFRNFVNAPKKELLYFQQPCI
jgi:hypothetical protein